MKQLSLKLIFVSNFLVFICSAQNWQPVSSKETFNFVSSPSQKIPTPIWVDSISVKGSDTIYHLNRFIKLCKNCSVFKEDYCGYPYLQDKIYLKDQGDFLQKKIRKEGNVYRFYGDDTFAIAPFTPIDEKWIFDTTYSVTAKISSSLTTQILGIHDSIKTILLSSGDTILLSENYGMIYFTKHALKKQWKLAGIEERRLGLIIPDERDYFNYEVGDIFEYVIINYGHGANSTREKYEIKSKQINGDTIKYHVQGNQKITDSYTSQTFYSIIDRHFYIVLSNTKKRLPLAIKSGICSLQYNELQTDSNGVISYIIKSDFGRFTQNSDMVLEYHYLNNVESMLTDVYKVGLGMTYSHYSYGGNSATEQKLIAYRKNNITVGTFTDTEDLTSILNSSYKNITFYPNPSSDRVKFDLPSSDEYQIVITDIFGKIMQMEKMHLTDGEINISQLPSGLYIVAIESESIKSKGLLRVNK